MEWKKQLLSSLWFNGVKEYSTVDGDSEKPIKNIHFTGESFDKFWNEIVIALDSAYEQGRKDERKTYPTHAVTIQSNIIKGNKVKFK